MANQKEVAEWMLEQLRAHRELYQQEVVYDIEQRFGNEFVYYNDNGNLAIGRQELREFGRMTDSIVVWERSARYWRFREPSDEPGRQQD